MQSLIGYILSFLSQPVFLWITGLTTAAIAVVLNILGRRFFDPASPDMIELELTYKPAYFAHILSLWLPDENFTERRTHLRKILRLDDAFAVVYALFFAGLLSLAIQSIPEFPTWLTLILLTLPFLAGLLDVLYENKSYRQILEGVQSHEDFTHIQPHLIKRAFIAAAIKWAALAVLAFTFLAISVFILLNWLQGFGLGWVLPLVFFIATAFFSIHLFPKDSQKYKGEKGPNVVLLQLAFHKAPFIAILREWISNSPSDDPIEEFRRHLRKLDYLFPIIYALFIATLAAELHPLAGSPPSTLWLVTYTLPFLAGFFDMVENTIHYTILQGVRISDLDSIPASPIRFASLFASAKLIALLFALYNLALL